MVAPRLREQRGHACAEEDVVAEDEGPAIAGEKGLADQEGLGQPLGPRLNGVFDREAECGAVLEEAHVVVEIFW